MEQHTQESIVEKLYEIKNMGWIKNRRLGNCGGVGNTLEDLLGVLENNLQLPDLAQWELKSQRSGTSSLTTLLHMEPLPRGARIVPKILLPNYGWSHDLAGDKYPATEMSFRQTINSLNRSDRGFKVDVNRLEQRIEISFDSSAVTERHSDWLNEVNRKVGLEELNPKPYWTFESLYNKVIQKLQNCFYVQAQSKIVDGEEYFQYEKFIILRTITIEKFISAIEQGIIYVDFDARTGHNHGTKFRLKQSGKQNLFEEVIIV